MKKIILCLVFLTACSQNKSPLTVQSEALSVPSESTMSSSFSFGESIPEGTTVADKTFTFNRASGSSEAAGSSVILSNTTDFALVSASGCNRDLVKSTDACYPKIRLLKKVAGTYTGTLQVGSVGNYNTISLTATVIPPTPQAASLILKEGTVETVGDVDYALVEKNSTTAKTFSLTNSGSAVYPLTVSLSSTDFILSNNGCTTSLAAGKTCYFKITFKAGAGTTQDLLKSATLVLASNASRTVKGTVKGNPPGAPNVKFYESSLEVSSLDFGSVSNGQMTTKVITVKNIGNAPNAASVVLSGDVEFKQVSNTCSSTLAAGASCYVRVSLQYSSNVGSKSATVTAGAFSLSLSGLVAAPSVAKGLYFIEQEGVVVRALDDAIYCGDGESDCTYEWASNAPASVEIYYEVLPGYVLTGAYVISASADLSSFAQFDQLFPPIANPYTLIVAGAPEHTQIFYPIVEQDPRGRVTVESPQSGRIYTTDGNINCGNGNTSCDYTYPVETTTIEVHFADIDSNYLLSSFENVGNDYQNYGTSSPFQVNIASGNAYLRANIQSIPMQTLTLRIRGGDVMERVDISAGSMFDSCEGFCSYTIQQGTQITLTGQSNGGKNFSNIECPGSAMGNSCSFSLSQDMTITTTFESIYSISYEDLVTANSTRWMSMGYNIQSGFDVYNISYASLFIERYNFVTDTSVQVRPISYQAQPQYLGTFGNKLLFVATNGNAPFSTEIFTIEGDVATTVASYSSCYPVQAYGYSYVLRGDDLIVGCISDFTSPADLKVYKANIQTNVSTLLYEGTVTDYSSFGILDYKESSNDLIVFDKNPNSEFKKIRDGQVIQSMAIPNSYTGVDRVAKGLGNKVYANIYGAPSLISLDTNTLTLTPIQASAGEMSVDGNYLYVCAGSPQRLARINLSDDSVELSGGTAVCGTAIKDQNAQILGYLGVNMYTIDQSDFAVKRFLTTRSSNSGTYLQPNNYFIYQNAVSSGNHYYVFTFPFGTDYYFSSIGMRVNKTNARLSREIYTPDYSRYNAVNGFYNYQVSAFFVLPDGRVIVQIQAGFYDENYTQTIKFERITLTPQ